MKKGIYINDSLHGLVSLSDYEKKIIASVGFNRLHDIYQNSTVFLTFPSNRTKRFEHSIGTMKLCSDMFFFSILNASANTLKEFLNVFREEYEKIIQGFSPDYCNTHFNMQRPRQLPDGLPLDERHYLLLPSNVPQKEQVTYLILIESIRVAALLHDVGHPPFSHVVESAMKNAYARYEDKKDSHNDVQDHFVEILSLYMDGDKQLHEEMGRKISESILEEIVLSFPPNASQEERLFYILIEESVKRIFADDVLFSSLHRLIDASLDGDRLDYVTRDPISSGINSGKIDYNRIINDMRLIMPSQDEHYNDESERFIFCLPLKAVNAVEDFVRRRYNVYKDIIYHHRVIKTDCLLEYAVKDLIIEFVEKSPKSVPLNNSALIPSDISGLWTTLEDVPIIEKSYALSQWNDAWLMTILKKIYYEKYCGRESRRNDELIMNARLSELLLNQKKYYSLIKRSEDFRVLDDAAKEVFRTDCKRLKYTMEKLNNGKKISQDWRLHVAIDRLNTVIKELLDMSMPSTQNRGFLISFLYNHYQLFHESKDFPGLLPAFKVYLEDTVKRAVQIEKESGVQIEDWIVCPKILSSGIKEPIYFYGKEENDVLTLTKISAIKDSLDVASHYFPVFYIYLLMPDYLGQERKEALLKNIGTEVGENFKKMIFFMVKQLYNRR